jgi:SPP1 gp7 family putative phage head morphogenesis protein
MPTPRTLPAIDAHQSRLLQRADASADAAEAGVRRVWLSLLRLIKAGGPWSHVYFGAGQILRQLPAVAHDVAADLKRAHRDAATWTAHKLAETLPKASQEHILRRRYPQYGYPSILEDESPTRLLVNLLLPPLDATAVNRVVYGSGWWQTFEQLTALAAPDALAAQIASGVQQGLSVATISRQIRPLVQGVQASARRVARTAGLFVAHEAERDVYRHLEGDLIEGYQIHAVLDHATRPAHRARDGQRFYCRPGPGQRGLSEMPRPPREADGSFAFNCRCWLEPILSVG